MHIYKMSPHEASRIQAMGQRLFSVDREYILFTKHHLFWSDIPYCEDANALSSELLRIGAACASQEEVNELINGYVN